MSDILIEKLNIKGQNLSDINNFLLKKDNPLTSGLIKVIEKYGGVETIKLKYLEACNFENQLSSLKKINSPYLKDIDWLIAQKNKKAFVSFDEFKKNILGDNFASTKFVKENAVTLEISALQYLPWLITEAKKAITNKELMPGRFIRVRNMKESEADSGDLIAIAAAMNIVGATWVETLDTKGTDGANVHLGGPETITGYFGGPGQPNDYPLKWADEFLYYHTKYGTRQVLNLNPGTVILSYLMYKLGVDIEFKISVFMGNDNPYSVLWTLMTAKLLSREDGSTPLIGFNFSNSVNNETIKLCSEIRKSFGFEKNVRFEHHITETWKHIVRQPYDRINELVEVAKTVQNISAKHEGGIPEIDSKRKHPSDILDYFREKKEVIASGDMENLELNYLDKHDAVNRSAKILIKNGVDCIPALNLHNY